MKQKQKRDKRLVSSPSKVVVPWGRASLLVFILGLSLSLLAAISVLRGVRDNTINDMARSADQMNAAIGDRILLIEAKVRALSGLFAASSAVESDELDAFVKELNLSSDSEQVLFWGWRPNPQAAWKVDSYNRQYVERLGIILAHPTFARNLINTKDLVVTTVSSRISGGRNGFVILKRNILNDGKQYQERLFGIYLPVQDLFNQIDEVNKQKVNEIILYPSAKTRLPLVLKNDTRSYAEESGTRMLALSRPIQVADTQWNAEYRMESPMSSIKLNLLPWICFGAGMIISFVLAAYLHSARRRTFETAKLASLLEDSNTTLQQRVQERDMMAEDLQRSEKKHRGVLNQLAIAVFETDSLGRISFLNAEWQILTGLSQADGINQPLTAFLHRDDRQKFNEAQTNLLSGKIDYVSGDARLKTAETDIKIVEIEARALRMDDGSVRMLGTIKDVTESRMAADALHKAEHNYREIFENAVEGIYQATRDGRFISANPALARILGYETPAELIAAVHDIGQQFHVKEADYRHFIADVELHGLVRGFECEIIKSNGTVIWIAQSARAVRDEKGEIQYFEGTLEDISLRKQTEATLVIAKEQADMASRAKSELLANMSHELRTPLNAIIGFSEIIKNQMFGPVGVNDYVDYAVDIYESGKHLLELINDILDVAKIEAGKRDLNETMLEIDRVANACIRLVRPRAESNQVGLVIDIPVGLPWIRAEELSLKQIMLNLLSNAVKFTPPEGTVTLSAKLVDEGFELAVTDTGIGIAKDDIAKCLQPFGQIDSALSRKNQGTGLGLTLVSSLVELHGGRFMIESEIGKGTCCKIILPADRVIQKVAA